MLYNLYFLKQHFSALNLFQYENFRAVMAAVTAFLVSLVFGRWFIDSQKRRNATERVEKGDSETLNKKHSVKQGTPTMGGVIILLALLGSTLLWARLDQPLVWVLVAFTVALGVLGFADDYIKLTHAKRKGLSARTKFAAQLVFGAAAGVFLTFYPLVEGSDASFTIYFPFFKDWSLYVGAIGFVGLVLLVTTSSSNAVNLTDGLDGLAIGCVVMVAVTFAVLGFPIGDADMSAYLKIPFVPGAKETSIFAAALAGAGLGFLWFNCHPAQIFMGDTGALPLGGVLGLLAVLQKQELLLLLVGGVFVAEAVSVILQVGSYKLRGKRIFLIAPLHHHYQFKGWQETKVTVRFWIVSAILSLFSLATLKIR